MAYLINDYNLRVDSKRGDLSAYIENIDLPVNKEVVLSLLRSVPKDTKLFRDKVNTNPNHSLRFDVTQEKNVFVVYKGVNILTTGELSGAKVVTINEVIDFLEDTLLGEEYGM